MSHPSLAEPRAASAPAPAAAAAWLKRAARAFQLLSLLLLPGLFVSYAYGNLQINDFSIYYTAARAAQGGVDPYSVEGPSQRSYVYPPGFAALVAPLALLPFPVAAVLWTALGLAAVLTSLWLCLDLLGISRGPVAWTVGGLALLCSGRMLDSELGNGQANHWVLLGLAACAWLLARGRPALGGLALSLAIVAKVTPLLLAVYLVGKREWRALAGLSAGLLAFGALLPALAFGPRGALDANLAWADAMLRPLVRSAPALAAPERERPRRVHGISLRALAHRHLTRTQAASHHEAQVYVNRVDWSPRTAELVYRGLALLALAAAALAIGASPPRDAPRRLLEVSIVAASMVLIAPLARKAHFVVLLLPFVYGVAQALQPGRRAALAWVLPPALVFIATSPGVMGKAGAALALAWGAYTAAALWLWAGALHAGWRGRRGA
ncbi:MAG TPA: glycosyltransferase family 87 protein [Myxococcota bacterium]